MVAVEIGFLRASSGSWAGSAADRTSSGQQLVVAALVAIIIVGGLAFYTFTRFYTGAFTFFNPEGDQSFLFQLLGWVILIGIIATVVGFLALLFGGVTSAWPTWSPPA